MSEPAQSAEPERRPRIGEPLGVLSAWLALAAIGAVVIAVTLPMPARGLRVRAMHHAVDALQLAGVGLMACAGVTLFQRWAQRPRWAGPLLLWVLHVGLGAWLLPEDLGGVARRLPLPHRASLAVLVSAAALSVPLAALAASWAARWRVSAIAGVTVALGVATANHFVLRRDYMSLHLFVAIAAATFAAVCLGALPAPWRRRPTTLRAALALAPMAALSLAAVLVHPGSSVMLELYKVTGAVVAPVLARFRVLANVSGNVPPESAEWFRDRSALPPIGPTVPALVPKNAVVLLVVVDCMRADLLEDETRKSQLPSMFALRDESVHFTRARTTAPATTQAVASFFTSKVYSQLYWESAVVGRDPRVYPHKDPTPRFPELLSQAGVPTVIVTGLTGLKNEFGISRGFGEESVLRLGTPAEKLAEVVATRLGAVGSGSLFLYFHADDAHFPYKSAGTRATPFEGYVAELGIVDRALGRILRAIDEAGLRERSVVLMTADHGEAFGEHGDTTHAHTVYDELLRVPFLVRAPGIRPRRVDEPVSTLDLGPSVLDLFGSPTPGAYMGQSLVPLLSGQVNRLTRPIVAESARRMQALVTRDGHKVIRDLTLGTVELYDLETDPKELDNLLGAVGQSAPALGTLAAYFEAHGLRREGYRVPYQKW